MNFRVQNGKQTNNSVSKNQNKILIIDTYREKKIVKEKKEVNVQNVKEIVGYEKMNQYMQFLNWVNISYEKHLISQQEQTNLYYKIYIGKGNNGSLIKQMFRNRWWW